MNIQIMSNIINVGGVEVSQYIGEQSLLFDNPPFIREVASITGKKEGEGPIGHLFDKVSNDDKFGKDNWDEAESELQRQTLGLLLEKSNMTAKQIRYIYAGDLLGQLIATSFGLAEYNIPIFGLYGACSTFGEAISLASMAVSAGYASDVVAMASSHFCSAEKQFRFPLEYGNQRPLSATWTVTGCGAVIVSSDLKNDMSDTKNKREKRVMIKGITTGRIVDYGIKDSMNMGAAMAPAACNVISQNFKDLSVDNKYYDLIITGDLGEVGKEILIDLVKKEGYDITDNVSDCGLKIYDELKQDTHSGGSGCGCSAVTFCSYVYKKLVEGKIKRVLFVPTGALLSPISFNEGRTVPGIAHGIILEGV